MRKAIIAPKYCLLGLVLVVGISSVGCKSMPKSPWSKTASTSDPALETLARSAPTKPSDLAKQAELAASQVVGGEAAPFVPSVSAIPSISLASTPTVTGSYPSTSAPSFIKAGVPPNVVASTPTPTPNANLGSVKLPYDPNAVPPAVLSEAEQALAKAKAAEKNRYASVPTSTGTLPQLSNTNATPTAVESPSVASRYGGYLAAVQTSPNPTPSNTPVDSAIEMPAQVAAAAESLTTGTTGGRYAQAAGATTETPPTVAPSYAPPTASTPTPTAVASAAPYRPGGTSSYPATMSTPPGIEIATRPASPVSEDTQVPNLGTPPAPYPTTTPTPRYR